MNGETGAPGERKNTVVENSKIQFTLRGFSQVVGLRVFAFEGIAADGKRQLFTVSTDLSLTRRYGIRLQDLPLLCRAVLERCHEGGETRAFAYTEEDMRLHADGAAARAEAAKQRKPPRRPASEHVGAAWRVPPW
jgi:hypothetical protein